MIAPDIWPNTPSCACGEFFDGWISGHLQGVRDGRAEIAAEQLEQQRRAAARMEPAVSVVSGLRAVRARHDVRLNAVRRAAA